MEYDSITVRPPACNWAQGACFCSSTDSKVENTCEGAPKSLPTPSRDPDMEDEDSKDTNYKPPRKSVRRKFPDGSPWTPPNDTQACVPLRTSPRFNKDTAIDDPPVRERTPDIQYSPQIRVGPAPRAAIATLRLPERRKPMPSCTPTTSATAETLNTEESISIKRELGIEIPKGMLPSPSVTPNRSMKVKEEPVRIRSENYAEMGEPMPPAPPRTPATPSENLIQRKNEGVCTKRDQDINTLGVLSPQAVPLVDGRHTAEEMSAAEAIVMLAVAMQECGGGRYGGRKVYGTTRVKDYM